MKIVKVPISTVEAWEKNPRGIKTKDFDRLKKQILKLGIYKPLVAYRENGKYIVLGGNMRIRALKELGIKEVDISVVEAKTEAKRIEYALSDNDRAGFYEEEKLAELVYPEIQNLDLNQYKVDFGEALNLKQVVERYGPDIDNDGADDVPEIGDTPAVTKTGDLFMLGKHRLLCGDSTKAADVTRLMRGEKAALFATDPPYGVDYGDIANSRLRAADVKAGGKGKDYQAKVYRDIENDDLGGPELQTWLEMVFSTWLPFLRNDSAWYLWHAQKTQGYFTAAAAAAGVIYHRQIVWVKPSLILGRGDYHWKHELCLYGWRKGHRPPWRMGRDQHTVWEIGREQDGIHPTQKPVEIFERPICNHLNEGELCADPFLGSGTTLIAAEKTGRVCYGMEIDPKYCDVIIRRYADYVGVPEENIRSTRENPNG